MQVYYGGLKMELVRVLSFDRVPVLSDDGTSYLFTKFTLSAVGIVNSQQDPKDNKHGLGMSYKKGAPGQPFLVTPAAEPETNPVVTDAVIRHWMSVPRRSLILSAAGSTLLQSPAHGEVCDAHNGPVVESYNVQEMMGNGRTFIVSFTITTYVNECGSAEGKEAALLANRWSQHHELDEHYGLTTVTTGTAYFRTDLVHSSNLNPDSLRPYLFLPIPVGFQRENIQINGNSDGSRLDYSFTDVQKSHQFVVGNEIGATKIEVNYRQFLRSSGDFTAGVLGAVDRIQSRKWMRSEGKTVEGPKSAKATKAGGPSKLQGKPRKRS